MRIEIRPPTSGTTKKPLRTETKTKCCVNSSLFLGQNKATINKLTLLKQLSIQNTMTESDEEDVPVKSFGRGPMIDSFRLTKNLAAKERRPSSGTGVSSGEFVPKAGEESSRSVTSDVSFGSVHVHKHRMTLGDNPEATGLPVTIDWEELESEELSVDAYEDKQWIEGKDHSVRKIAKSKREKIALQNHTRQSLRKVQEEISEIKLSRQESEKEDLRRAIMKEAKERNRSERKSRSIVGRFKLKRSKSS